MSLPPGFLDELRNRISLAQVVGRKVTWESRKSNPGKGDMWAPCPFHQEKTASFHVDDRKGFYYCFGCHAKGDAIGFVKETENVGFMEAVEILAREAGMQMPARDPKAQERRDRRAELAEVMEAAVRHYRMQLKTGQAAEARAYLDRRKLDAAALDRFEIGFAPDARQGLFQALTAKGIAADLVVDAGLCAKPDDGGAPYDRFRGRIIFPIRDARGRCIGLGGRAMDPNARAKYLNSPETELFDKGRSLYNHGPAREAAGKGQPLIVAEGYMDVIALVQAGFGGAVAPLGTAITEDQLQLLWRIHPEPVVALDGDAAGLRAALRLVDLALPLIAPDRSLRFALMPGGQDPDDLIRAGGPAAMQAVLDAAEPLVALLWRRETDGKVFDSPERRAALDRALRAALGRIGDPGLKAHYGEEIRRLRAALFGYGGGPAAGAGPGAGQGGGPWPGSARRSRGFARPAAPLPGTRSSLLATAGPQAEEQLRESIIVAICAAHPGLVSEFEAELDRAEIRDPELARLRDALLVQAATGAEPDPQARAALDRVLAVPHVAVAPPVRRGGDAALARACLAEELARLAARRGAEAELEDAIEAFPAAEDEALTWRLGQAAAARQRAEHARLDDTSDMGEDRDALSGFLDRLIESRVWEKKKG